MPSVREIAELAGVSKSTISLVLNNKPGVSGVMRKRILSTLETLQETEAYHLPISKPGTYYNKLEEISVGDLHPAILVFVQMACS